MRVHTYYIIRYQVSKFYLLAPGQTQCPHIPGGSIAVYSHSKSKRKRRGVWNNHCVPAA